MKKRFVLLVFALAVLALMACSEKSEPLKQLSDKQINSDVFVIALLPEQNVFLQKRRYTPLAEYLSKTLGLTVKTKLLDSYDAIYNEMLHKKVDAAFFGSSSYLMLNAKINIEPVARPVYSDGSSTYRGVVFSRRDKGISADVRTWKGKRIALVNKSTTAGYIFPKWYLQQKGITNFDTYFSKIIYTGSHDAAVISVFKGDVEIGCAKDWILNKILKENAAMKKEIVVLAVSVSAPSNTLGIRADTDPVKREQLKRALLGMDTSKKGREALAILGATRFVETKESEYEPVVQMLKAIDASPVRAPADSDR